MVFLVWCMSPIEYNGSEVIYRCVILPFFMQHKDKIEKINGNLVDLAKDATNLAKEAAAGETQKGIFDAIKNKIS